MVVDRKGARARCIRGAYASHAAQRAKGKVRAGREIALIRWARERERERQQAQHDHPADSTCQFGA
jgi:hypothetical protein